MFTTYKTVFSYGNIIKNFDKKGMYAEYYTLLNLSNEIW